MMRRSFFFLVLVILQPSFQEVALAEPSKLADTLKHDAKRHYDTGRALYRTSDYGGALASFQRAYELSPDPRLLWNMAACEKNQHHYAKVLALVDRYLGTGGALLTDGDRGEASAFRDAVRALVSDVTIVASEAGAAVFVDDEPVGTTPLSAALAMDPGVRRIRVVKSGFKEALLNERIPGAAPVRVAVSLVREVHDAHLAVAAQPEDAITVDERTVGAGTWSGAIAPGSHVVRVTAPGKKTRKIELTLREDESRALNVELEHVRPSLWPWFVGGGIVLLAGASVGGYFLLRRSPSTSPVMGGNAGTFQLP